MPQKNDEKNVLVNMRERWIFIHGWIGSTTVINFEKHLEKLAEESNAPVVVILESVGGDMHPCLKIYQDIRNLCETQTPIDTVGLVTVQSGAFYILQAGMRRFAVKGTIFRFHRAIRDYSNKKMNSSDLADEINDLNVIDAAQLLIFTRRGRPISKIRELFKRDAKIDTRMAQKLNLIDEVIPGGSFSEMQKQSAEQK